MKNKQTSYRFLMSTPTRKQWTRRGIKRRAGVAVPLFSIYSSSSIGIGYRSFGLTLIGGLTTATLLTLLVVPVFYTLFDDVREAMTGTLRSALGKRKIEAGEPMAEGQA